jgi:hypothetical protein
MSSPNEKNSTSFTNFDDFLNAQSPPKPESPPTPETPLHERAIDRDEFGDSGVHLRDYREDEPKPKIEARLRDLFPMGCIDGGVIRNLLWEAEDIYEKVMGICMVITVAAIFNPVLSLGFAFASGDGVRGGFGLFLVAFFLFCILAVKKVFPLIGMGIIAFAKGIYFHEGQGDLLLAAAMLTTIYLMFSMKKRKDGELALEGMRALREELEEGDDDEES